MRNEIALPNRSAELRILFGPNDAHLRMLRSELGVQAVVRRNRLVLEGPERAVTRATNVVERMLGAIESGETHLAEELATLLVLAEEDEEAREAGVVFTERRRIEAKSEGQRTYLRAIRANPLVFGIGPAGCGKTFLAVAAAVEALRHGEVKRLVLTRPAVEAGERLGFLPGDLREKVDPYLRPIYDALEEMLSRHQLRHYAENGVIEVAPLAFMRGRTLSRSFVILDEAQNTTPGQMKMLLTRLGEQSHAVVTGDITQIDLSQTHDSGLLHATRLLGGLEGVGVVELTGEDIVRHRLVREIVDAYREDEERRAAGGTLPASGRPGGGGHGA